MPSPFPGMNPYLEEDFFWQDFHLEFLPALRQRLVIQVRPKYIVMLDSAPQTSAAARIASSIWPSASSSSKVGLTSWRLTCSAAGGGCRSNIGRSANIYATRPEPRLSSKDATWARTFVPAMP